MFDYRKSPCLSHLECLITTNGQNVSPKRFGNELISCKNLRLPSYYISVVYVLFHQLFGDHLQIVRLGDEDLTFQISPEEIVEAPNQMTVVATQFPLSYQSVGKKLV